VTHIATRAFDYRQRQPRDDRACDRLHGELFGAIHAIKVASARRGGRALRTLIDARRKAALKDHC